MERIPGTAMEVQDEEEDFTFISNSQATPEDIQFDLIVERLQESVLSKNFQKIQQEFIDKYSSVFEDTEENKIQYTGIFNTYQSLIQKHLLKGLESLPDFSMEKFTHLLDSRRDQVDEQLLDMLISSTDFSEFKRMMLDAKKDKQHQENLEILLTIKSNKVMLKSDKKPNNIFSNPKQFDFQMPLTIEGLKAPLPGKGSKKKA